ncbi:MAG: DUF5106 domain-containing protein [Bacteroidales bacterium]|jgi:thioredoxin-related protein|nr:DUF5106 domain-containing protein [Bacteroidales bacterium]
MKHPFIIFFCAFLCIANAQSGYQIRIKTENISADSLFVKAYNTKEKKYMNIYALKFGNDITIKDKTPLIAGIYVIEADSMIVSEFLISDAKNQKFTISLSEDDLYIDGSKENSANRAYMKKMFEFNKQLKEINDEFQKMQQKEMPNSMMQAFVDTFIAKFNFINDEKRVYQERIIKENKGQLLATIIQSSLEFPPPPQDYYRNRVKLFSYTSEHLFDDFPWEDDRLINTPVLYNKYKTFAQQILNLETGVAIPIVLKVLNESKKNRNIYYVFFDFLEHDFGNIKSPYRDEKLYISMLQDILETTDLEETRKQRYQYELNLISKNLEGEFATDFNILFENGDTTHLYAIEAEYLILYFQNPDCPTCGEIREKMKNMEVLYNAIVSGKVKVVTVYFESKEELWHNYLNSKANKNWMHGWNYDLKISEEHLYDIRLIPTIMILDNNKRVLRKDIFSDELESWLKKSL